MGQILCKCGRVAELRRRKNGQKLPYLHCKSCGLQQGKDALRAQWLANEDTSNNLGVLGEFANNSPSTSNETNKTVDPEQVATSSEHQKEWSPPDELLPEEKQVELAAKSSVQGDTSKKSMSLTAKVLLGVLGVVGLAFGVSKLN